MKYKMPLFLKRSITPLFFMLLLSSATSTLPGYAESTPASAENVQVNKAVTEWFEKYDAIRRDAEMSTGEKLKHGTALKKALKSNSKLSEGTKNFIEKMRTKYEVAATAIKQLAEIPETKQLHEGYIQYFTDMEHSFAEILKQDESPASTQSKVETKAKLDTLSAKNKTLDASLRQKYGIAKHQHS